MFSLNSLLVLFFLILLCTSTAFAQDIATIFTLEESIQLAEKNNLQIRSVKKKLKQVKKEERIAKPFALPSISFTGNYTYFGELAKNVLPPFLPGAEPVEVTFGAHRNFQAGLAFRQPLFASGRHLYTYQSVKLNVQVAEEELKAQRNQLNFDVAQAFYGLLATMEFVKVSQSVVDLAEQQLSISQKLFDSGTSTNFDVLRAKVQLANAKSELIRAKNAILTAKDAFKNLLNIDQQDAIGIQGDFNLPTIKLDLDQLIQTATKNRSELNRLNYVRQISEKEVARVKTNARPSLSLFSNYQLDENEKLSKMNRVWNIGLSLNYPIFDGLVTKALVQRAELNVEQLALQEEQTHDLIKFEVRSACLKLMEVQTLIEVQKETIEQAKEGVRLANLQYENGLITSVQLTDAQLALTQAKISRLLSLRDYAVGYANLQKAVGTAIEKNEG
ncbi:TPA: TolC family protein [Candidatus Poribacteria bacterium]|nr:TolC family protein [Candidatus Poribacteria bacterium]HIC01880.1 TolC family protein [Candidatus Poribacteria bacterium]HIO07957.1 TolC family protein [Candidatus Poribacteria bacterium]